MRSTLAISASGTASGVGAYTNSGSVLKIDRIGPCNRCKQNALVFFNGMVWFDIFWSQALWEIYTSVNIFKIRCTIWGHSPIQKVVARALLTFFDTSVPGTAMKSSCSVPNFQNGSDICVSSTGFKFKCTFLMLTKLQRSVSKCSSSVAWLVETNWLLHHVCYSYNQQSTGNLSCSTPFNYISTGWAKNRNEALNILIYGTLFRQHIRELHTFKNSQVFWPNLYIVDRI